MWFPGGRAMSVTASDFNNDGRLEVLSANDAMENYYFEMNEKGVYASGPRPEHRLQRRTARAWRTMGPVVR